LFIFSRNGKIPQNNIPYNFNTIALELKGKPCYHLLMINEPKTLYKLMVLHMLRQVNFPLTENQISDFFLSHDYTNYFTLKQVLAELIDSKLIDVESIHNTSRYEITEEGDNTLGFFGKDIPSVITEDIDVYLRDNRFKMRSEVSNTSDYYKSTVGDYVVHCEVREGKSVLVDLNLSVPDEEQAQIMTNSWQEKSSEIYASLLKTLLSNN